MRKRRAQHAPVGLTSNGIVLVNVLGLMNPESAQKLRAALPKRFGGDCFVGVPLDGTDTTRLLERLDDAAAEAVAKMKTAARSSKTRR